MTTTQTVRGIRNVLAIAAGLALAIVPAAAAVHTQHSAPVADGGSLVADATITPALAVADTVSPDGGEIDATEPQTASTAFDDAVTSPTGATAAQPAAASVPSDKSGSSEAREVKRSCGAKADSHYVPSSGKDSNQCYDNKGKFQSSRTYTATHYTNDVACGGNNRLYNDIVTGTAIYGAAGTDGGYVAACADGSNGGLNPAHGRMTASADAGGSAQVVFDGDRDNPVSQDWASATVSTAGPEYRCGKSYAEGGRGTADAPTSADNADQCAP